MLALGRGAGSWSGLPSPPLPCPSSASPSAMPLPKVYDLPLSLFCDPPLHSLPPQTLPLAYVCARVRVCARVHVCICVPSCPLSPVFVSVHFLTCLPLPTSLILSPPAYSVSLFFF